MLLAIPGIGNADASWVIAAADGAQRILWGPRNPLGDHSGVMSHTDEPTPDPAENRFVGPTVDVHAHVMLEAVEALVAGQPGLAESRRRELGSLGARSAAENGALAADLQPRLTEVDARIAHMDVAGVDAQLVSVSPAQYHYWAEPSLAREVGLAVNEGVRAHCAARPGRLTGLGVVPLQHPDLAVELLEHAVSLGLQGIEVSTYALDVVSGLPLELADPRLEPLWGRAAELGALVLVHPFGCTLGARLDRSYLANVVGQPLEHTIALSHLIFGGVFDRHPALRLLATHGGGYLPAYLGRSDRAWRVRDDAHSCAEPPSSYLSKILVDSLVLDPGELARLVARMGADRVLMGSDDPFDMGEPDPVSSVRLAGLGEADVASVVGGNAVRLGLAPAGLASGSSRP